ncbi:MAG: oligosaccharide flippase family protein, partial [Myxococcales bacterium]|nr:oligosaccharide flippase family protein [Myxococcales bacterium]
LRDEYASILGVRLLLIVPTFAALILLTFLVGRLGTIRWVVLGCGISVLVQPLLNEWVLMAKEQFRLLSRLRIVTAFGYAAIVFVAVRDQGDLVMAALLFSARQALLGGLVLFILWRRGEIPFKPSLRGWRSVLRGSIPLGVCGGLERLHGSLDLVLLAFLVDSDQLGQYSAALYLVGTAMVLRQVLVTIVFPRTASLVSRPPAELAAAVAKIQRLALPLAVLSGLFGTLLAPFLISFAFGPGYE